MRSRSGTGENLAHVRSYTYTHTHRARYNLYVGIHKNLESHTYSNIHRLSNEIGTSHTYIKNSNIKKVKRII